MMTIILHSKQEIYWHIGERNPLKYADLSCVVEVAADRYELEYIQTHFANLPMPKDRDVCSWFGNLARFIVANIGHQRET